MHQVLADVFADPLRFLAALPPATSDVAVAGDEEGDVAITAPPAEGDGDSDSPLASLCAGLSKAGHFAAEFLSDIYGGEFDADFKTLAAETSIQSILGAGDSGSLGALGPKLREFMRLATPALALASSTNKGAPALTMRCLAKINSDPGGVTPEQKKEEIIRERQQLWAKARTQRKRFCRLVLWTGNKTKETLEAAVKKASAVSSFTGKLNDAHRAHVMSCDLLQELDVAPWSAFACPKGPAFEARLAYLASRSGPVDFCFLFDGRCRVARRALEDHFAKAKIALEETWIVFSGGGVSPSDARSRKVCLASSTKEVMFCKLPCARVRLTTKPRDAFAGAGEDSTFHTTFTGVPIAKTAGMARISIEDKKGIFPSMKETEATPPSWRHDGVPLFWNESKTHEFWRAWIEMFDIKAIVDVSPGTGQLAIAALKLGVQYVAICSDERHMSVLQNIVDREALRCIGESGSAVYHEELSVHIAEHFADVLEELNAEEGDDDGEEGDDQGDDGVA